MVDTALKKRILGAVEQLPPDSTLEDVIVRGRAQADAGQLIPHERVAAQFKR